MTFLVNPYWYVTGEAPPSEEAFQNYYSNDFDGVDDFVDVGIVNPSTSALSISLWVYSTSTDASQGIYSSYSSKNFNVTKWNNQIWFGIKTASWGGITTPATFDTHHLNKWTHICCTWDGSTQKIYLDGVEEATGSKTGTITYSTDETRIGDLEGAAGWHFVGKIDEVAVFDSGLSASDVTAIYNSGVPDDLSSTSNLKEWWRMGDGANYPIIKNQAHFSQTAVNFDGTDDLINIGRVTEIDGASTFSICGWYNQTTLDEQRHMWGTYKTAGNRWTAQTYTDGKLYIELRNGGLAFGAFDYSTVVTAGEWFHFAVVFDGGGAANSDRLKAYVNGSEVTLTYHSTIISALPTTTEDFNIGAWGGTTPVEWLGQIDDFLMTTSALSASDITDIYNSGYPKDESERSGLLRYYKFDGDVYPVVQDAMQFSNASLLFDGANDLVDIGRVTEIDGASSFSICGWYNQTTIDQLRHMWGTYNSSTNAYVAQTYSNGNLYIELRNSVVTYGYFDYSTVITAGEWFHFAVIFDGSGAANADRLKAYVNGSEVTLTYSGTIPSTLPTTTEDFYIGAWGGTATVEWLGRISNFLMTTSALSSSDVTDIYNSGKPKDESSLANILGYWRLGDNVVFPHAPSALGYGTHSVEFDGTDDYIDCGNNNAFEYDDAFSISCWVYHDYTTNRTYVAKIDNSPNTGQGYYIGTVAGPVWRFWIANNYWGTKYMQVEGGTTVTKAWHHIVATYDGSGNRSGMKIYLNGAAETLTGAGATSLSDTIVSTEPLTIGNQAGGNHMAGHIAQVGIFNVELSASDVTSIYNSGKTKDLSGESGLVSYYRMGDGEDKYPNILDYKGTAHGTMTNMASDDITTDNVGSGDIANMASDDRQANSPAGTSGQMTNMASDDFVAAKGAGTMTNMTAEDIVASTPS